MSECIFCRIVAGELPADVVAQTPDSVTLRDRDPQAPVHVLVVPRSHFADVTALADVDPGLAGRFLEDIVASARELGLAQGGFRVVLNTGVDGGQTVAHLHAHLLGGRALTWPPG